MRILHIIRNTRIVYKKQSVLFFGLMSCQLLALPLTTLAQTGFNDASRITQNGAEVILDGSLHVTGADRTDKFFENVGVSTPSTPPLKHSRTWLNPSTKQICTIFDDGSNTCLTGGSGVGTITGVTAGLGLVGGGTTGNVTLNLSTPIADSFLDASSVTLQGNPSGGFLTASSATVTYLQDSSATLTYLQLSSATATYLQGSSATATYLQLSSATQTYLQQSSATATYLQQSSATVSYCHKDGTNCTNIGGTGTVNTGSAGQAAYYVTNSSAVSGTSEINIYTSSVTLGDTTHPVYSSSTLGVGLGPATLNSTIQAGTTAPFEGAGIVWSNLFQTTGNGHGFEDESVFANTSGNSAYAAYSARATTSGGPNFDHILGFQDGQVHGSTGTLQTYYGFLSNPTNSGGTITDVKNYYAGDVGGAGSVTNQYMFYAEAPTKGGTKKRAFYANGGPSEFKGGVVGTTTNDNASTGVIGEYVSSGPVTTNSPASGTFFDVVSISITAGDWDLSGCVDFFKNAATFTSLNLQMGISSTSGNSSTGLNPGDNYNIFNIGTQVTTFSEYTTCIPSWRVSISGTTSYYLKALIATYSAGTPQAFGGRLSARRVR